MEKKYDRVTAREFAMRIRKNILRTIASKGTGHVGGALSIADALAVLYGFILTYDPGQPDMKDRDYLVLSKGHTGPALYAALSVFGFFPEEMLDTLNQNNTKLPSHADRLKTPGIDVSTGSLGQGASLAAGVAFSDQLNHSGAHTWLILGDGELDEGQVWEAALFTAHRKLTNLITVVDANGKQLDGTTDEICSLGSIEEKFRAFGYHVISVEKGNDVDCIYPAFVEALQDREKPSVVVLHTVKGAGVHKYASMANCHSTAVSKDELPGFYAELDERFAQEVG